MTLRYLACAVLGFLLGSLNGAILISRLTMHEDVREKGSGNAGMTNFLRNYGGAATVSVVLIDIGKIVLACLLAGVICPENVPLAKMLAGVCVQLGHIFPCFFGFRGGKGILCSAGLALMMDWRIFAICFPLFVLVVLVTHYVSLGSLVATALYAVTFVVFFPDQPWIYAMAIAMAVVAFVQHRGNILRLLHGEERKTYFHKK